MAHTENINLSTNRYNSITIIEDMIRFNSRDLYDLICNNVCKWYQKSITFIHPQYKTTVISQTTLSNVFLREWEVLYFNSSFTELYPKGCNLQQVSIGSSNGCCPACRTTLIATRFRVAVICPIIQVPHCIRVFFYFVWFVFINHIFQFHNELCTYCNILDIYLS